MTWFWWALVYVGLVSGFYYLSKKLLNQKEVDPRIFGGLMNLGVGIIAFPVAWWQGFVFEWSWSSVGMLMLLGLVITVAASLYYEGLKRVDLSESNVLESSSAIWVMFLGFLIFGEDLSRYKILAVLMVMASVWLISGMGRKLRLGKYELMILVSAIFYAIGSILDKYFVGISTPVSYLCIGFLTVGVFLTVVNLPRWREKRAMFSFGFVKKLAVICLFISVGYGALLYAYKMGEVSRVGTVIQTQVGVVGLMGIIFLKERKNLGRKLVALVMMLTGLYLIRI